MQTAVFHGGSDDLVEIEGVIGADEFNVYDTPYDSCFNLGGRMRIRAIFDGVWSFAVGQVGEEVPLPAWPIRLVQDPDTSYSVRLEIDCPDDVAVFREAPRPRTWRGTAAVRRPRPRSRPSTNCTASSIAPSTGSTAVSNPVSGCKPGWAGQRSARPVRQALQRNHRDEPPVRGARA